MVRLVGRPHPGLPVHRRCSLIGWSDLWRDYDRPEQASLWRWDRPQIAYHLANFSSERARKKQVMATYLNHPGPILNVPNRNRKGPTTLNNHCDRKEPGGLPPTHSAAFGDASSAPA